MELELPKPNPSQPDTVITPSESCHMFTVFQKIKHIPVSQDDVFQKIDDLLVEDPPAIPKKEPVVAPPNKEIIVPERL